MDYKLPPEELDTEFKKEFPPDAEIGREMRDDARVWKVYRKEANAHDIALLDGWSSTLDILLIFVSNTLCYLLIAYGRLGWSLLGSRNGFRYRELPALAARQRSVYGCSAVHPRLRAAISVHCKLENTGSEAYMCGQTQRFAAHVRTLAQFRTGTVTTHSNCVLAIVHLAIGSRLRAEPGINNLAPFRENKYLFSSRLSSGGKAPRGVRAYGFVSQGPFPNVWIGTCTLDGTWQARKAGSGSRDMHPVFGSAIRITAGCPIRLPRPDAYPTRPAVRAAAARDA